MSTYLAAWVVAPFESISALTKTNKINVSVVATKEKLDLASFALDAAVKVTENHEKYFGIDFPLKKQGTVLVAVNSGLSKNNVQTWWRCQTSRLVQWRIGGWFYIRKQRYCQYYSWEYILCENWCHCNTHTVERRDVSDSTSPMTKIVTEPGENLEVGGDVHVYIPSRGSVRQFSHHKPSPGDESRKSIHPLHIDPYGTSPPP